MINTSMKHEIPFFDELSRNLLPVCSSHVKFGVSNRRRFAEMTAHLDVGIQDALVLVMNKPGNIRV